MPILQSATKKLHPRTAEDASGLEILFRLRLWLRIFAKLDAA